MITSLAEVNKFPIVLIGPPSSGSSVICRQVAKDLSLPFFSDITWAPNKNEMINFTEFIKSTDKYVLKCHAEDLLKFPKLFLDKVYNDESYNIKIIRGNKIEQLASIYIAQIRNTYAYFYSESNLDTYNNQVIKLDKLQLFGCLKRMNKDSAALENLKVSFAKTIVYEDCVYDSNLLVVTPKPENYDELKNMCENLI